MKVLHFSALDGQTGAGVAAARIHEGLRARGVQSRFCLATRVAGTPESFTPPVSLAGRLARALATHIDDRLMHQDRSGDDYILSSGYTGFDMARIVEREAPDVVQLHWIAGGTFRLSSLKGLRRPTVWRLSDQWPFCGVQHLEPDPARYTTPPTGESLSERVRRHKLSIYRSIPSMTLACPSRWMLAEAGRSVLLGDRPAELIATSCDTTVFAPKDLAACRQVLGLSADEAIVLVGATSLGTRWKGLDLFIEAMQLVGPSTGGRPVRIVTFGQDVFAASALDGQIPIQHMGPVKDRRLMAMLYSAADVYAAPSRMENLSNAVLEALACGAPVVAFSIGGMPDMIEHQVNGALAAPYDVRQMADGLSWALTQPRRGPARDAARRKILREFSLEREIDQYIDLYRRLTASRGANA